MIKVWPIALLLVFGLTPLGSGAAPSPSPSENIVLLQLSESLRKDAPLAEQAALALARMGPKARPVVPNLIEALGYDEDSVYRAVSDALAAIGTPAIRPVEKALNSPSFIVRRRAAEILSRFGTQAKRSAPELVQLLKDPQYEVREAAAKALTQLGEDAIPALSHAIRDKDEENARSLYLDALSHCGPKAIPVILDLLKKDRNVFVRARAANAAVSIRPVSPEVVNALAGALKDIDEGVRNAAADALGDSGDAAKSAIGALTVVAESDLEALTRKKASDALARLEAPKTDSPGGGK